MAAPRPARVLRADEIARKATRFSHPLNPRSLIETTHLSALAGLQRTGLSFARLPPGKESFVYHSHLTEEEWIYVLEGQGVIEIDGQMHELGPGDFVGFPAPSQAHHLHNPFHSELVYLMGGEHREAEIAEFPRLSKRMVRIGSDAQIYDDNAAQSLPADLEPDSGDTR